MSAIGMVALVDFNLFSPNLFMSHPEFVEEYVYVDFTKVHVPLSFGVCWVIHELLVHIVA